MAELSEDGKINFKDALALVEKEPKLWEISDDKKCFYKITRDKGGKCGDFIAKIDVPSKHISCVSSIPFSEFTGERKNERSVLVSGINSEMKKLKFFISGEDVRYEYLGNIYKTDLDISFLSMDDAIINAYAVGTRANYLNNDDIDKTVLVVGNTPNEGLDALLTANTFEPDRYTFISEVDKEAYGRYISTSEKATQNLVASL